MDSETMKKSNSIRAVIFPDHGKWVAQCLEVDVGAQGDSPEKALANLEVALKIEGDAPSIGPAPKHYFDLWEKCSNKFRHVNPAPDLSYALCA